jgi:hypothetical protein
MNLAISGQRRISSNNNLDLTTFEIHIDQYIMVSSTLINTIPMFSGGILVSSIKRPILRFYGIDALHAVHNSTHRRLQITQAGLFNGLFGGEAQPPPDKEEEFGAKFVPLNPQSDSGLGEANPDTFGPLALLAVNFSLLEFSTLQDLFQDMEGGDTIKLIPAQAHSFNSTLADAFAPAVIAEAMEAAGTPPTDMPSHQNPPNLFSKLKLSSRNNSDSGQQTKVVFLSGMYSSEVVEVVGAVKSLELGDCAFAAAVPKSWNRNLGELVEDVCGDHEEMRRRMVEMELEAAGFGGGDEEESGESE